MEKQPFNPFEFLTTPWAGLASGQGLPPGGSFNPTDLQDLDRRIQELKAVEQWLSLNLNLLKTTIQTMEVQRGTIAAIQSFTAGMAQPPGAGSGTNAAGGGATTPDPAAATAAAAANAGQWWETMQGQFGQMMQAAQASAESLANPGQKPAKKPGSKKNGA